MAIHGNVVTTLEARNSLGKLLRRAEEGRSVVISKRGVPRAVLLSIRDYVRLASPEPEVLKDLRRLATNRRTRVTPGQIQRAIKEAREKRASHG